MSHWVKVILEDAVAGQKNMPDRVRSGLNRIIQIIETSDTFQLRTAELEEIADAISVCDCLSELSRLLWRSATSCGFQNFSLFVLSQGRGPVLASRMLTSLNSKWISRFEAEAYQFVDPVLSLARIRDGSFMFSEAVAHAPTVEAYWIDAEEHNIGRHGLCYAGSRPNGARFAVSFFSRHSEAETAKIVRLNRHDLEVISQLAIECFCYSSYGETEDANMLTVKELRFLHTLASADNPKIAFEQTAAFGGNSQLQAAICNKLNVATIFQAIALASSKQWFDSLPYYSDEVITPVRKLLGYDMVAMNSASLLEN